jgi:2'-5' RNA ligase
MNRGILMNEELQFVSDHWWWREGWSEGKRFYTWHFTFENQIALNKMASDYQKAISKLGCYDMVPLEWLHLTTQGIGFADSIETEKVNRIVKAAEGKLASQKYFQVEFGIPKLFSEAISSPITPTEPLAHIRESIREAIAEVMGKVDEPETFHPHVSFAYSNRSVPVQPIKLALEKVEYSPITINVRYVDLIRLGRDRKIYEWELVNRISFRTSND